jgi:OmpA-OmpF porin, OOP family
MEKNTKARVLSRFRISMLFIFLLAFLLLMDVKSQNLVCNPSFEKFYSCPKYINGDNPKDFLPCWTIPTRGTPDYFNACSRFNVGVPDNNLGSQFARDGNGYIGLVLFENKVKSKDLNYREYVAGKLLHPVKKDSTYHVSFYYTPATYSTYAVNQLQIGFCKNEPKSPSKVFKPDFFVGIDNVTILVPDGNWKYFCDTLTFQSGYSYIVLGNFICDQKTRWQTLDISEIRTSLQEVILDNRAAYYYIDMVDIHPVKY